MRRGIATAVVLGSLVGAAVVGDPARPLTDSGMRGAHVDYVLASDHPARVAEIVVTLRRPGPRAVRVRLGGGTWISCRVTGATARCRVPAGEGAAQRLERVSVAASD